MAAVTAPTAVLHCVYDPLCGWCYAAAPLLQAATEVPGLAVALHGGGMLAGAQRRTITPAWRDHVMPHDRRIAELTGQPFGAAYFDGLLRDVGAAMDSAPPITAVLAAEALAGQGLAMSHRLQRAHYVEGRRISEPAVLAELAADLGLDGAAFRAAFAAHEGAATTRHIAESRALLGAAGGQGFPTFVLERPGQPPQRLDHSRWYGQPEAWQVHLGTLLRDS